MKKLLVGVFAHPDDEAFGPSGSLYLAAKSGVDIHTISATQGDAGVNLDHSDNLAVVRAAETYRAAELIGTKSVNFLSFADGKICNSEYHDLANKIISTIHNIAKNYDQPIEIDMLGFDPNGLSGHIDHITVSLAATYCYLKLRDEPPAGASIGRLKYFCLSEVSQPKANTDWLYMPKGHPTAQIDETIDVSSVFDHKLAIMRSHHSQRNDAEHLIKTFGENLKQECFFYYQD